MLSFNSILLSTENLEKLVEFYKKVLKKDPEMSDDNYAGFVAGNCFLNIGKHDKVHGENPNPERFIINFETDDVKGEFERIKELGAKVIADPYQIDGWDGWIATLSDPDDNYFQLMTPWDGDKN